MELVIDIETTITPTDKWKEGQSLIGKGKGDSSPFNPKNKIVSIHHKIPTEQSQGYFRRDGLFGQYLLDYTTLLIGHNIKFDLTWLKECGFKYDGKLWDTQIYEYVKMAGQFIPRGYLKLGSCCKRYGLATKTDEVAKYWERGVNTDDIPKDILEEYGNNDVEITHQLYKKQMEELNE